MDLKPFLKPLLKPRARAPAWTAPRTRAGGLSPPRDLPFGLQPDNGLWTHQTFGLKVADVRRVDEAAKSVRVIGQGNQERRAPLPEAFGQVFGVWQRHPHSRRYEAVATLGRPESPRSGRHCRTVAFNDG